MSKTLDDLTRFVEYARTLDGDDKGEAQVFCDRLFHAFGHKGYKEAGGGGNVILEALGTGRTLCQPFGKTGFPCSNATF